jgi:outer membrane protein, heavy metal efflux system
MGIDGKKSLRVFHYQSVGKDAIRTLAIAFVTTAAAGCATVPQDAGFQDVQAIVATRTGQRIQWNRGAKEDKAAHTAVQKMLGAKLNADEAVQIALLNNRQVQAIYEDLNLAQATLVQAGLLSNPVFDARFGFVEGGGPVELSFSIVQNFLSILYRPLRKQIAATEFDAAKRRVAGAVIDLAGQVRSQFYEVQADQQRLVFLQQVVKTTKASAEAAQRLHNAGNITGLDLAREQALYQQSRLALATAELRLIQDRERLNARMGLWGEDTQWTVASRLPEILAGSLQDVDLEQRAIKASLHLSATRKEIRSTTGILGFTNATALIPFLTPGVDAEREEGPWELGPTFSLPVPLFDQGPARVAAARSDLRRAQHTYWMEAVEIRAAVRAARASVISARARALHVRNVLLPLATRIVNDTQLQFNAMQLGIFQLLLAKVQQIDTGLRYIDALNDYWHAHTALQQILSGGRLSEIEVTPITEIAGGAVPAISLPE